MDQRPVNPPDGPPVCRNRIEVTGVVQGVGFRPFVARLAHRFQLTGFVQNHPAGVTVEVEGPQPHLAEFTMHLRGEAPPLARIATVSASVLSPVGSSSFQIASSIHRSTASIALAPDVGLCQDCRAELLDPRNRRYRYPFLNCTQCGPRYTILRETPWDRTSTTMNAFRMCAACEKEYQDPTDRRFHAEPNACPACGPQIWFLSQTSAATGAGFLQPGNICGAAAIAAFHDSIAADQIIAVKGVGGFHLACAADSSVAIRHLRQRKGRPAKPLAIMVADLEAARSIAHVTPVEAELLSSAARPIVLLRPRACHLPVADIAPGIRSIGIMLPYSPLHELLTERRPLVMTSGNISDEPLAFTNQQACSRLHSIADAFLLHDREIHAACDDSVMRVCAETPIVIRRARGFAPLSIGLADRGATILAAGGDLKSTFCITHDGTAWLSPHIGNAGSPATSQHFEQTLAHFQTLLQSPPEAVACDQHPGYVTSDWARRYAEQQQLPLIRVQHHHAHIAAVLAEHQRNPQERVIGISFDGTGYGTDGTIWGGEVLLASCVEFQRWAHLQTVSLAGGDAGVRHPARIALSHLWSTGLPWDERLPCVAAVPEYERRLLRKQLERDINCVPTSSMGRLFDAVAALAGVCQSTSYEGQAAMELESLADEASSAVPYSFRIIERSPCQIDLRGMLADICHDVLGGVSASMISSRFHRTVAQLTLELCQRARDMEGIEVVALSGGVFQNVTLTMLVMSQLQDQGFEVLTQQAVPPNDGGLSLGQAIIAASLVKQGAMGHQ
ncbi:MAG: carbamoyltransferase HypF [Planctomycetaceae bacterium]|nr:carbamoyltransferase HypF [Planctomycetaceae bacterium]